MLEASGNLLDISEENENEENNDNEEEEGNEDKEKISHMLFIGGNSVQEDIQKFQKYGANIMIGTPGRLEDLLKRSIVFNTREVDALILDEADRYNIIFKKKDKNLNHTIE